jgi:epoxyqueuosine reductase QueG
MIKLLERIASEMGADMFSYASIVGHEIEDYLDLKNAISFGIRLSDPIMDNVINGPTHEYFSHYRSVNALIDQISLRLVIELSRNGYRAIQIAASQSINKNGNSYSGLFSHRKAAVLSGLGYIGKNNSVITKYGPRVRFGTVLTNLNVENFKKVALNLETCGECNLCVVNCPALALSGKEWNSKDTKQVVDVKACSDFMSREYKMIGRGSVCGICLAVCPKGGKKDV